MYIPPRALRTSATLTGTIASVCFRCSCPVPYLSAHITLGSHEPLLEKFWMLELARRSLHGEFDEACHNLWRQAEPCCCCARLANCGPRSILRNERRGTCLSKPHKMQNVAGFFTFTCCFLLTRRLLHRTCTCIAREYPLITLVPLQARPFCILERNFID
jgi:hypothetical protein